jgi:hypothetical protein
MGRLFMEVFDIFVFDFNKPEDLEKAFALIKKDVGEKGVYVGVVDESLHITGECKNINLARKICKSFHGKVALSS